MSFDNNEQLDTIPTHKNDYDPCAIAKVASPFYLYNHDSPRPSENKSRTDINITVQDLESGLTPQTTTAASPVYREKQGSVDSGQLKNGSWRKFGFARQAQGKCMTKPKVSTWKSIPQRQRHIIKILIALIMVGLIVGLAVGLTKALGGGVWKNNNSTSEIN
jgi:hypothetical protein